MDAYGLYRSGHFRLRGLFQVFEAWVAGSPAQVDALRGLAVLLCAEFEAYLRSVVQDIVDAIADKWDRLLPAQRRLVAQHALNEMGDLLVQLGDDLLDTNAAERVATKVKRLNDWLESPGQFARDVPDPRLLDLHDPKNVATTVDKSLVQLREDGMPFFDWLGSQGADQSSIKDALRELVRLRNDAAHQERLGLQPTPSQLRQHFKVTATLVRAVRAYVANVPRGAGRAGQGAESAGVVAETPSGVSETPPAE